VQGFRKGLKKIIDLGGRRTKKKRNYCSHSWVSAAITFEKYDD
jgi:hypothetical protein